MVLLTARESAAISFCLALLRFTKEYWKSQPLLFYTRIVPLDGVFSPEDFSLEIMSNLATIWSWKEFLMHTDHPWRNSKSDNLVLLRLPPPKKKILILGGKQKKFTYQHTFHNNKLSCRPHNQHLSTLKVNIIE